MVYPKNWRGGMGRMRKTQIADRIGRQYEVRRILEGGMGIVYVCLDLESRNVFALKTFQDKYLTSNEMKGNFRREALAWIHLEKHPNIVRAIFVQELDLRLFIALDAIIS